MAVDKTKQMNRHILLLLSLLGLSLTACNSYRHAAFSKKDVRSAQKLVGLDFSKTAIDTMYRYLGRNRDGYDSLRNYTTDYRTEPPLFFDPRPYGFTLPQKNKVVNWPGSEPAALPTDRDEVAFLSIPQLAALLRSGELTSVELTELYLDRIDRYDDKLNAVITITRDRAMRQARKADAELKTGIDRGPLHGIPYGVKDLLAVEGYPTTWGAAPYRKQTLDYTATVVERLDSAGAVLIAKLTSGSLARGDVWFGGKTRNPWDLEQGASGSSAGSASATAAGLVGFSIGTETLGSITSPSTRCGATGLRPTYGRVPRTGVMSLSWTMDKVGPICRTANDCALVLAAIYGPDGYDRTVVDAPFAPDADRDLTSLKVAYLKGAFTRDSSDTGSNDDAALALLGDLGLQMDSVALPDDFPWATFDIILRAEAGAFFDELVRSGEIDGMVEQDYGSRANSLRQSRFIPAVEYLQANRQRRRLIEAMHELISQYDLLITPNRGSRQLYITNLTGHPALSLPTGFDEDGHPTSLTLLGNLYDEAVLLEVARAFQQKTDYESRMPPLDE